MIQRPFRPLLALAAASILGACGGGGGGSTPKTPTPTPTPTPTATPVTNPACHALSPQSQPASTYTLTSNPTGIAVQRVDPSVTTTTCVGFSGVTTTTDVPQTAPHVWNYVFAPTQASPYVVSITQQVNGNHTLFYNQAGDSTGAINPASLQSIGRSTASATRGTNELRRGIRRFTGTGVDPHNVLVRYRGTVAQMRTRANQIAAAEGVASGAEITTQSGQYQRFIRVPDGTDAATFAAKLRTQSDVSDVFPVHLRVPLSKPPTFVSDPHGPSAANSTDQWYLFADGFPYAWSYTHGAIGTGFARIAMIDTGVDLTNTDLTANQKIEFSKGYQTLTAQDTNGHGTNTASIAAAATNNATGFAGAGYDVHLLVYNIFGDTSANSDSQTATVADEVSAIIDAVQRGADVISLSLGAAQEYNDGSGGGNGFDTGEQTAIENAIAAGVVVVAAAGNDADGGESGTQHIPLDYPAAYDNVISVGASALTDTSAHTFAGSTEHVASYSQYGPGLGVVAPGGDPGSGNDSNPLHWIWNYSTSTSNFPGDQCKTPSPPTSCTAFFAGTSQATPQVSAAAALLMAQAGGHRSLTPARVAQLIDGTADNINDPHQGHGRLNIYKALAAFTNDPTGAAYTGPTVQRTSPTQTIAFAYTNSGSNKPVILDQNYPTGVPLDASGNFRIADVLANVGTYRVGVWYDANANGVIDAGDQFGAPATSCNSTSKCVMGTITMTTVPAGTFALP